VKGSAPVLENEPDDRLPVHPSLQRPAFVSESLVRRSMPIYIALLFAILTVFGILVIIQLKHVLLLVFISFLFAATLSKPTARLEQLKIPRIIAALMIYLALLGVIVGLLWFTLPVLFGQVATLTEAAPEYADRYQELRERYDELAEEYNLPSFDEQFAGFQTRITNGVGERLVDLPTRMFGLFLDILAVFVMSLLILTSREKLLDFLLSLVHPDHREATHNVIFKMWERVGYYLRAKAIVMLIVGVLTYISLILIGVPYPLLLSIIVALGELVPRVGAWVVRIPLFAIAALEGWVALALTFGSSVLIQNLEGSVISPLIQGDQLDIHPLLVFVAVLAGAVVMGPAGAFVAVPAAAMIQVIFEEVIIPKRRAQLLVAEAEAAGPITE
jgi:putative permease